jgi:antitoxin (DNA-binding transcriptional repressor) of toxin-antitoxin stability system
MRSSFSVYREGARTTPLDYVATRGYIRSMREVGIRELKNRLSEYVRLVKEGEVVMVTDRGEVVAELRAPEPSSELEQKYPLLAEMARQGLVRMPLKPNAPGIYALLPSVTPPGTAAKLLDEVRGDR